MSSWRSIPLTQSYEERPLTEMVLLQRIQWAHGKTTDVLHTGKTFLFKICASAEEVKNSTLETCSNPRQPSRRCDGGQKQKQDSKEAERPKNESPLVFPVLSNMMSGYDTANDTCFCCLPSSVE
ncbi:hypothetical protein CDAR_206991 [Caerostris darwini]|uniref:Uncharacterized protein n=1 Tax=Caerostris darwini TaxID=1538125 RepID=A0AAV4SPG5_9ARAC|nr:hypothetical protein CDAR_206991 [Caerostris darwini]